jgi:transcriptional regulator with XRE-family HTH domain
MVTKEEINGYFLEAIRRLKAQGYTQKDIVEAAGLSQNAISKIKTGQNNAGDDTINKLCNAFKLNPDFFYRGSKQFKMEEAEHQPIPESTLEPSTVINVLVADYTHQINRLEDELKKKEFEMAERLAEKDAHIAALERTIKDKETRIIDLERQLAAATTGDITRYPFKVGVAEELEQTKM